MSEPAEAAPPTSASAITFRGISKSYPGAISPAVENLSIEIPQGELVVLVGPSGCGKTTTLRLINRLEEPTSGNILINGIDSSELAAHELRRGIGYVIQQGGLFPHHTVAANIACVPRLLGWSKSKISARVDELVEVMRLDPSMLDRYPSALSGGQQQRVGVARALAADPPILLMDEPYSAVDPVVRAQLRRELMDLQDRFNKTIVLVTHDIDEAIELGDRVAVMQTGGRLAQYSVPTELLASPADDFVREFLGADRTLRRLSLLTVTTARLEPTGTGARPEVTVDASMSLRSTLDAMLTASSHSALVVDLDGSALGVVTMRSITEIASADPDTEPMAPWVAVRHES